MTGCMPVALPTREVEDHLFARGTAVVLGVDEVGRGAIAGPCAVGIAAAPAGMGPWPDGLRDSKLVSERRRGPLAEAVAGWLPIHAVGYSSAVEIDAVGITEALRLAAARAFGSVVASLDPDVTVVVLLDGSHNWLRGLDLPYRVVTRVKADRDCVSVAAASVLAKVDRDQVMAGLAGQHPAYGWESNKGYGSAGHYAAIAEHGPVPGVHRVTWLR